ncbi:hypothetical protein MRX96_021661 [Rhipicephalus microplus]
MPKFGSLKRRLGVHGARMRHCVAGRLRPSDNVGRTSSQLGSWKLRNSAPAAKIQPYGNVMQKQSDNAGRTPQLGSWKRPNSVHAAKIQRYGNVKLRQGDRDV